MRYACIARRRDSYPVRMMCPLLDVSRSGSSAFLLLPPLSLSPADPELLAPRPPLPAEGNGPAPPLDQIHGITIPSNVRPVSKRRHAPVKPLAIPAYTRPRTPPSVTGRVRL